MLPSSVSKAFTREDSEGPAMEEPPPLVSPLPPGARNLMTPSGADRLRSEHARLIEKERPALVEKRGDAEAERRLRALDQRIFQLGQSLESAEVITPPEGPADRVTFGATVLVRGSEGEETFRIVGVDETDHARGWVSYLSPVARALMNARVGQSVCFKYPCGEENLEVIEIRYE